MKSIVFLAIASFGLIGCQQASTLAPSYSEEELNRERQTQSDIAKQTSGGKGETKVSADDRKALLAKLYRVAQQVVPASVQLCKDMFQQSRPCSFDIALAEEGGLNAYADGEKVVMFPEMVAFTKTDAELALVLSHELAHNIMRHPDSTKQNVAVGGILGSLVDSFAQSQGINTGGAVGQLGAQGAQLRYSKGFETEADYVGIYIMQRSNYDVGNVADFWRRMSTQNPDGIYVGSTHPTNPDRYLTIQKTINEVQAKKASGAPLIPQQKTV
jgi:beta-barrel assembly-enhancing protease